MAKRPGRTAKEQRRVRAKARAARKAREYRRFKVELFPLRFDPWRPGVPVASAEWPGEVAYG